MDGLCVPSVVAGTMSLACSLCTHCLKQPGGCVTSEKDRYGAFSVNLFPLPPFRRRRRAAAAVENHFSLFLKILPWAQPRSHKAVCVALNELIPYLWGLGTIYRRCNVITGTRRRTGTQQVANTRSFHHLTPLPFPITPTPRQPPR